MTLALQRVVLGVRACTRAHVRTHLRLCDALLQGGRARLPVAVERPQLLQAAAQAHDARTRSSLLLHITATTTGTTHRRTQGC
jgi:hypothetical protein